jgi:5-methylcytosine-specific restriction protein A
MPRAVRRCGKRDCDQPMPCAEHAAKPWAASDRRATLPSYWGSLATRILKRDKTCQLHYPGTWHTNKGEATCTRIATEVDHIGSRTDHSPKNLRGVCSPCHRRRTQEQANMK